MAGRLIVFEGTDGSGKSTQFARLCRRLEQARVPFHRVVFPQYQEPSSALVRMYLGGEFGRRPGDVNAYAASAFYAVDRYASYKKVWGDYYEGGGLVLADRYTTSNAVHQASKLPQAERAEFFRWLYDFELTRLGLPAPDKVLYLDMPTDQAVRNLRAREADTHTAADIHEVDTDYLSACRAAALQAAQVLGWQTVSCVRAGALRSIEDIHQELWDILAPLIQQAL
jgi:dTMP kinase